MITPVFFRPFFSCRAKNGLSLILKKIKLWIREAKKKIPPKIFIRWPGLVGKPNSIMFANVELTGPKNRIEKHL
jgi:hypothetical protein